jgi:hypothetical protein
MHRGLPCSGLSLKFVACEPLGISCSAFSSFETTPPMVGPTCDDDAHVLIKWMDSRIIGNLLKTKDSVLLNIFFWIEHKITNPTELVSWFLELWAERYEFSKFEFEYNPR